VGNGRRGEGNGREGKMGTGKGKGKVRRGKGAYQGATENAGPGQCRTWKMTDQIAGLENARTGK